MSGFFRQTDCLRHFCEKSAVQVGVTGGHEQTVGFTALCRIDPPALTGIIGSRPVAVVGVADNVTVTAGKQAVLPCGKTVVGFPDDCGISRVHPCLVGCHQVRGADWIRRTISEEEWCGTGNGAVDLFIPDVPDNLREHTSDIEIVRRFLKAYGGIVHPAHPLVSLGTVGKDGVHIVHLGHDDVFLDLVHESGSAGKQGAVFQIGAPQQGGQILFCDVVGTGDFRIPEAVEGETGFPEFTVTAVTGCDVGVGAFRIPQRRCIQGAVLVQLFRKPDGDDLTGLEIFGQTHPDDSGDVLTEIHDKHTRLRRGDLDCGIFRRLTDGFQCHGTHHTAGRGNFNGRCKSHGCGAGFVPVRIGKACIVGFPVEDGGVHDRSVLHVPLFVGGDGFLMSVGVPENQHRPQLGSAVEIRIGSGVFGYGGIVVPPAFRHLNADCVLSRPQKTEHIGMDGVIDGFFVFGKSGIQSGIGDILPTYGDVVISEPGGVQAGTYRKISQGEVAAEVQNSAVGFFFRADPFARKPIFRDQTGDKGDSVRSGFLSRSVAQGNGSGQHDSGGQGSTGIRQGLFGFFNPAAVPEDASAFHGNTACSLAVSVMG